MNTLARRAFIVHRSSFIVCHLEIRSGETFVLAVSVMLVACGKPRRPAAAVPIIPKATSISL